MAPAPDNFQEAWQSQSSQTRFTVDTGLLQQELQRNQREFRAQIFRRDALEIGVGLLLLPLWFFLGITMSLPWTWYLSVPAIIWVCGFLLVDRWRRKRKASEPGEPLLVSAKTSLSDVEHQIWLLRNVFWWYLLPPTLSILAFFAHVTWLRSEDWLDALSYAGVFVFLLAIYSFVYWVNQLVVRTRLEPRRQELLTLLINLGDETTSGEAAAMKIAEDGTPPSLM